MGGNDKTSTAHWLLDFYLGPLSKTVGSCLCNWLVGFSDIQIYLDAKQNVTGNHLCLMELLFKPLLLHHRTFAGWEFVEHHDQYFLVRTQ